jgi:hypothetical protein
MVYTPASFETFGLGLNLRDKVDAVRSGEAIDCLNVEFTERGAVRQRGGYANFSFFANDVGSLHAHYRAAATPQLLAGCGTRIDVRDNAGAAVTSITGLTDGIWDFARFGAPAASPNAEVSYAGQGLSTLKQWDGSAWSTISNTPKAGALAVMAVSNRLVAGRFLSTTGGPTGAADTSSPSHVYFSDPGLPETWTANNFIQVTPGDGETVQAVVAWRELIFIFKETKFFVVYGESVAGDGNPIFDYRAVDTGVGLASPRAVCVSEQGVFFMDRTGVYITSGGEPTKVSSLIDPIFKGGSSSFYLGGELDHNSITDCAMAYHEGRVYLSFPISDEEGRTLVFDPFADWWSLWDLPSSAFVSFKIEGQPELFFAFEQWAYRQGDTYTNDDFESTNTAIASRWRSGWFDYDNPVVKTIRESKLWGAGVVGFAVSRDFRQDPGTLSVLSFVDLTASSWSGTTWGGGTWSEAAGLIARLRRHAIRGAVFSTYLENSTLDQTFSIHRCDHHLREQRVPSVKTGVPA